MACGCLRKKGRRMTTISDLESDWKEESTARGGTWNYRDLSGEHLGVRIEELSPGATSSEHHFHTTEEEHVIALAGEETLVLGDERLPIKAGQHVCFKAGDPAAHHIVNSSESPFRFLVFGERRTDDDVVYPGHQVMMVKALDFAQFTYRPLKRD